LPLKKFITPKLLEVPADSIKRKTMPKVGKKKQKKNVESVDVMDEYVKGCEEYMEMLVLWNSVSDTDIELGPFVQFIQD
jgi:hypothetical protein